MRAAAAFSALAALGVSVHAQAEEPAAPRRFEPWMGEFSLGTGVLAPSSDHNLQDESGARQPLEVAPEFALRLAFVPSWAGVELEGEFAPTRTDAGRRASLWLGHASGILQWPLGRFAPFVTLGAGRMRAVGPSLGDDSDPSLRTGLGLKYLLTAAHQLRLDVRDTLTQKNGASQGSLTHSPALVLSFGLVLRVGSP
jgi:hypothetical protein